MALSTHPVRLPVGALVAVAPPGAGKTTILRANLLAAGLPAAAVVSRDDVRVSFGNRCQQLACRAIPGSCHHHEDEVTRQTTAAITTLLAGDGVYFLDQTGLQVQHLKTEIERAHAAGVAAVALRRIGEDGEANISFEACQVGNVSRSRRVPDTAMQRLYAAYEQLDAAALYALGFDLVVEWNTSTQLVVPPLGPDARHIPDDDLVIAGDIHGCATTFFDRLLPAVGLDRTLPDPRRLLVSVGDVHDKGPDNVEMIRWFLWALRTGRAYMVASNHSFALVRALTRDAPVRFGLADTIAQIEAQDDAEELKAQIVASFSRLPSHLLFPRHVVAHAAMTEDRLLRTDSRTRSFALYTRSDANWTWTGPQTLVHGHEIVPGPARRRALPDPDRAGHVPGEVINVDTGAYEGGGMSAYLSATGQTVTVPTAPCDAMTDVDLAAHHAELVSLGIVKS